MRGRQETDAGLILLESVALEFETGAGRETDEGAQKWRD